MVLLVKSLLLVVLFVIFWQDYKERLVFWFLYPIFGLLGFILQLYYSEITVLTFNTILNLIFILTTFLLLWVYFKVIRKKQNLTESMGMGDVLFFLALPFCFASLTFLVLFVFSLFFSLLLHLFLKKNYKKHTTVPLAGYMALFFSIIYATAFYSNLTFIFAY